MTAYFKDKPVAGEDPVVYKLYSLPYSESPTDLMVVLTVLYGGRIGLEPFHTKGHFHHNPDGAEYVIGLSGRGTLELGSRDGTKESVPLTPGAHILVPPGLAHRALNMDHSPLLFVSLSSPAVGHDYQSVESLGWVTPQ